MQTYYSPAKHAQLAEQETLLLADTIIASPARTLELEAQAAEVRCQIEALRKLPDSPAEAARIQTASPAPASPPPPAPRKPARRKKAAPKPTYFTLITNLQNNTRDELGIRAWVEYTEERIGGGCTRSYEGFVQAPDCDPCSLGYFEYFNPAVAAVNSRCSELVMELCAELA